MRISARNQLLGRVVTVTPGAVERHGGGRARRGIVGTASITEKPILALGLTKGDAVTVIVRGSD